MIPLFINYIPIEYFFLSSIACVDFFLFFLAQHPKKTNRQRRRFIICCWHKHHFSYKFAHWTVFDVILDIFYREGKKVTRELAYRFCNTTWYQEWWLGPKTISQSNIWTVWWRANTDICGYFRWNAQHPQSIYFVLIPRNPLYFGCIARRG